jgi:hypothetical protein
LRKLDGFTQENCAQTAPFAARGGEFTDLSTDSTPESAQTHAVCANIPSQILPTRPDSGPNTIEHPSDSGLAWRLFGDSHSINSTKNRKTA